MDKFSRGSGGGGKRESEGGKVGAGVSYVDNNHELSAGSATTRKIYHTKAFCRTMIYKIQLYW